MSRIRVLAALAVLAVAATLMAPVAAGADHEYARRERVERRADRVAFDVVESYEQLAVTGLSPGTEVELLRGRRRGWWRARSSQKRLIETGVADDLGSYVFRDVAPGRGYTVRAGGESVRGLWVRTVDGSHPSPEHYRAHPRLEEGFGYIETRDGTRLSAYVVLPGPPEDGPYPTVVEYSGYDPSNPIDGIGGLGGGLDPTPFCGALPVLCKAPAQPGSLLAGLFGYAVVGVNVRGTGCSGGSYDFFEDLQVLDGYDVIETVAAEDWVLNNHVGMVGLSYPGLSQLFVAKSRPPGLAAITPLSVYGDTGTGVLAPGGMLNTGFALSWAEQVLANAEPSGTSWVREIIADGDTQCAANQQLRLQNVDAVEKARANPFYTDEVAGPLDIRTWVDDIDVPVFLASAFQDEQTGPSFGDLLGNFDSSPSVRQTVYNGLHADGFAPQVMAEWGAFLDLYVGDRVPEIEPTLRFLAPLLTGAIFGGSVPFPPDRFDDLDSHAEAVARWEAEDPIRILFDNGAGAEPVLPVAGWEHHTTDWPLPDTEAHRWYLTATGALVDGPTDPNGRGVSVRPDPAVSQTSFHVGGNIWGPDVEFEWTPQPVGENARFETAPLDDDVVLAGTASVDLWLRTDATEAELEAVITEIRPDGREVRVQAGQLQVGYRAVAPESTELNPVHTVYEDQFAPLVPGQWVEARIQVPAFAHAFRVGSRIRLTINTPGGDTAGWEFELDGPGAEATHVIGTGGDHASSIAVPMVALEVPTELPACGALRGQPCRPAPPIENLIVAG